MKPKAHDGPHLVQLTPPRHTTLTPANQVEMIAALAQARRATARGIALEIAGEGGHVRFLVRTADAAAGRQVEAVLTGYYPQGATVPLHIPEDDPTHLRDREGALAAELRLRRRCELPLRMLARDEASAQLLRVLGALRSLPTGTRALCQLILWPAPSRWGRDAERWLQQERLRRTQQLREATPGLPGGVVAGLVLALLAGVAAYHYYRIHDLAHLAGLGLALIGVGALAFTHALLWASDPPPDPELVERKLATPAVAARLRLLVAGGADAERRRALDALIAAYGAYEEPRGNGFVTRPCAPRHVAALTARGAPPFWHRPWPILSAAEVAALVHLPADTVEVPGLGRTGSRTLLPAAEALKDGACIGTAALGPNSEAVHIPHAAYRANALVLGATGTGKSTFLQHYARDAIRRDDVQLVVVDPDSALVADMVGALPDHQKLRAVVIDFGQPEYAVGLNLLDAYTGRRPDQVVESLVQAWARYYGEAWGPRLEDLVRYACATLLAANRTHPRERQYTLLDVKPLLQVAAFREQVVEEAGDIKLTAYWREDYLGMPRTERLAAIKPVLTRVNRFLLNDAAHAIVGQPASALDVPRLLRSGAPLFIDAAAHRIGEETAALLDAVLLNVLHDAVCERPAPERARQVLIVVDEFQHAPALWDEYLPRIRKHGGAYVLAAQGLATIDRVQRGLHTIVVGNTATHVVFRTPDPEEARYLAAMLDNAVAAEDLQTLGLRRCYVKTSDAGGPLPVVSATLPPPPASSSGAARLIAAACARRYGRPVADVMEARTRWMTELFHVAGESRRQTQEGEKEGTTAGAGTGTEPTHEGAAPHAAGTAPTDGAADTTQSDLEAAAPGMGPGSQPYFGMTVTRGEGTGGHRSRRAHRREGTATQPAQTPETTGMSADEALAGLDPLPVSADGAQPRQLPLLPDADEA